MAEIPASIFLNVLIYLTIPFLLAFAFRKINISPIIGYIVAGVILGNAFGDLISKDIINNFAFFGIVLLLFTIGLEMNLEKMLFLKRFILLGGALQIGLSIIAVSLVSLLFQFTFLQSVLIGIAFASSSTALVAKIIQDRGEESSFVGEMAIGLLMFQDLAFIPFIIIFTYFNSTAGVTFDVLKNVTVSMVEVALILISMIYIGRRLVPFFFNKVVKSSRELLNIFIIIFIFFVGFVSTIFHIPILIGMFIAGILVSQTLEHHHIFSQIRPIRDILAIIFFVFIGTHIELSAIAGSIPSILLFSVIIILLKSMILLGIFVFFRFSSKVAFTLAIFLFQVSENAFILLSLAFTNGIFTSEQYVFIISSVLVGLILTPILINGKDKVYTILRSFLKKYVPAVELFIQHKVDFDRSPLDELTIKNHVVICGYGRVGSHVGRALMLANVPFIAIDYNFQAVEKGKREGIPIIYGDPTDRDILDYAETEHAVAIVAAIPDAAAQEAVILNAMKLNPKIFIIGRVHKDEHQQRLRDLGAHVVVQPELEASLTIIKKLLLVKKLSKEDIIKKLRHFKIEQGAT